MGGRKGLNNQAPHNNRMYFTQICKCVKNTRIVFKYTRTVFLNSKIVCRNNTKICV